MKIIIGAAFFLWCLTTSPMHGQEFTYPSKVAEDAESFLSGVRSGVVSRIRNQMKVTTITEKDLATILAILDDANKAVDRAAWEGKLDLAAQQIQGVSTQLLYRLKDPGNKNMALDLEPEQWLREIHLQKSRCDILRSDLSRVRGVVDELRQWTSMMKAVAPPTELNERVKFRLTQLLSEFEQQPNSQKSTTSGGADGNVESAAGGSTSVAPGNGTEETTAESPLLNGKPQQVAQLPEEQSENEQPAGEQQQHDENLKAPESNVAGNEVSQDVPTDNHVGQTEQESAEAPGVNTSPALTDGGVSSEVDMPDTMIHPARTPVYYGPSQWHVVYVRPARYAMPSVTYYYGARIRRYYVVPYSPQVVRWAYPQYVRPQQNSSYGYAPVYFHTYRQGCYAR